MMMEKNRGIGFRPAAEEDRDAILEMMRVFYTSDAVLTDGSEEIYNADIDACLSDSPYIEGFVFTTEDTEGNENVHGYAMLAHSFSTEFGCPVIWIEDLYLCEEIRGCGAASMLFDYLTNEYPDAIHRLEVELENEHATEVYRSKGFETLGYSEMIRKMM